MVNFKHKTQYYGEGISSYCFVSKLGMENPEICMEGTFTLEELKIFVTAMESKDFRKCPNFVD